MLKLGVFELTGCGGCALNILFLNEKFFDILHFYEIKEFHMASSIRERDRLDVALVAGSISTRRDLEILKRARDNSDFLVALGTCATHGGVQGSIEHPIDDRFERVYGSNAGPTEVLGSKPIIEYVTVDYALPGCPYDKDEIYQVLMNLARGVEPPTKDYPVCIECKLNEYECVLVKRKIPCLGPITLGGCDAVCVKFGVGCIGCRGPLPKEANPASEFEILKGLGYDEEYIRRKFKTFAGSELKW